ncbi:MAG: sterol desaturase family protein [Pseudomonadota bacterium]|nr:sterol desaturase family protein [Pseudomonadota bacterium]
MDDSEYGKRDKRGDWKPFKRIAYPPVVVWPAQPVGFVKWLFGYPGHILPWNFLYASLAIIVWMYLTPPLDTMQTLAPGWIGFVLARNAALTVLLVGFFHWRLYVRKAQGKLFKYNAKWLDTDNPVFLFRNQTVDNIIWTFASGVPIWTAYEVLTLWAFANGYIFLVSWETHPVYCVALLVLIPLIREVHFYLVHRLIHWPALYRTVHNLHHNNVNPGPWSGLAMHPGEHLLYFSGVLVHWILPSHPIHALFHLLHAGLSPAQGHTGFEKVVVGKDRSFDTECYAHYLHHKYFECNYADGAIPLDRWFGTFHDGSEEAHEAMNKRFLSRHAHRQPQTT